MSTESNSTTIPTTGRHVAHNTETGRYDVYVNGRRLGDRSSEDKAQTALYDLEQAGRLYTATQLDDEPIETEQAGADDGAHVTIERRWSDQDDNPDGPQEGAEAWTDYQSGCVLMGVYDDGRAADLNICGVELSRLPVTLASLSTIYNDLGRMLSDPRALAALKPGDEESPTLPPTTMVRVKDFTATCSFPLALSLNLGCAIDAERSRGELRISRDQMYQLFTLAAQVVEDMFDLTPGLGVLRPEQSDKLVDAAYQQGFDAGRDTAVKGLIAAFKARQAERETTAQPTAPAYEIDRTGFDYRVGELAGTLTCVLTDMPSDAGEGALALLNDLIGLLRADPTNVPALAV